MSFQIFQASRLGKRKNNEDRIGYCYSKNCVLLAVADGMGGYEYGEVASQLAIQTLSDLFRQNVQKGIKDPKAFLLESILEAHKIIMEYALKRLIDFPRTTIVLCLIHKNTAYWAHAGDSRLYVIRNKEVFKKTHDHCHVNDLLAAGKITQEEANVHPDRNKIYSCLGGMIPPLVSLSDPLKIKAGDIILLATDGLWGNIDDKTLIHHFGRSHFKDAMDDLLDIAEKNGGKFCDNLSTVSLLWEAEPDKESIVPEALAKNEVVWEVPPEDSIPNIPIPKPVPLPPISVPDAPLPEIHFPEEPKEETPQLPVEEVAPEETIAQLNQEIESAIADIRSIIAKVAPAEPKKNPVNFVNPNASINPSDFNFPR